MINELLWILMDFFVRENKKQGYSRFASANKKGHTV